MDNTVFGNIENKTFYSALALSHRKYCLIPFLYTRVKNKNVISWLLFQAIYRHSSIYGCAVNFIFLIKFKHFLCHISCKPLPQGKKKLTLIVPNFPKFLSQNSSPLALTSLKSIHRISQDLLFVYSVI